MLGKANSSDRGAKSDSTDLPFCKMVRGFENAWATATVRESATASFADFVKRISEKQASTLTEAEIAEVSSEVAKSEKKGVHATAPCSQAAVALLAEARASKLKGFQTIMATSDFDRIKATGTALLTCLDQTSGQLVSFCVDAYRKIASVRQYRTDAAGVMSFVMCDKCLELQKDISAYIHKDGDDGWVCTAYHGCTDDEFGQTTAIVENSKCIIK